AERLEITALKAAGISLYRVLVPYLVFAVFMTAIISFMDGFIIPGANKKRIAFEREYLRGKSTEIDSNRIFRQESENIIYKIGYYDAKESIGYRVDVVHFQGDSIKKSMFIQQMKWQPQKEQWKFEDVRKRIFTAACY